MKEENFELRPTISASDKDFKNKIGGELWEKIKSKTFRDNGYKCQGCGFEPYNVAPDEVLDIHLEKEDFDNYEESILRITCKLCHIIEHADVAIKNEYVLLVNSHFSQGELVNICRNKSLSSYIESGDIRLLKKTFDEFLEELNNGKYLEGKVKFVFTEKYLNKFGL